jgi:ribosomal protein L27
MTGEPAGLAEPVEAKDGTIKPAGAVKARQMGTLHLAAANTCSTETSFMHSMRTGFVQWPLKHGEHGMTARKTTWWLP